MIYNTPEIFMQRALDLASLGLEYVSPNPMVGCVIVKDGLIIGEGYHKKYGEAHAEANAIDSVVDKTLLIQSTVYVTLEPCSHFGKTPPCVDLILKHKIPKVVICNIDPNPLVNNSGIKKLKQAGVIVETGLLEKKGTQLNKRFFKAQNTNLPYITIKWAETADGFVALSTGEPLKITNSLSDVLVHKWRVEEDGIMVGSNTILSDNPRLNNRHWPETKHPTRLVIDKKLKLTGSLNVFDDSQKTIIFNTLIDKTDRNIHFIKIDDDSNFLQNTLLSLKNNGINSILVEGGPLLINTFFDQGFYDEIRVLKNNHSIKKGIDAPKVPSGITLIEKHTIMTDFLTIYKR